MKLTKNEKGITLVALIITIIILLILAIVSIRAIKDGGILSKTQTAKETYSEAEEKEKIQLAINQAAIDGMGTINKAPLETALKERFKDDFQIIKETEEYFEVKIKSSGRIYTINKNGSIDKVKIGKKGESWANNGNGSYTKGDETVTIGDTYTNGEVKSKLEAEGVKCKDGSYTGEWEVIGVEDDKIKLVSMGPAQSFKKTLGYNDPVAVAAVPAEDESNNYTDEEVFKRAVYSYAHAVDTLNKVASETTGIEGARSITLEDILEILDNAGCGITKEEMNSNYGREYTYNYANSKGKTFVNESGEIVKIDSTEKKVQLKWTYFYFYLSYKQEEAIRSLKKGYYWLATPCVSCGSSYANFYIYSIEGDKKFKPDCLYKTDGSRYTEQMFVRAVIYI